VCHARCQAKSRQTSSLRNARPPQRLRPRPLAGVPDRRGRDLAVGQVLRQERRRRQVGPVAVGPVSRDRPVEERREPLARRRLADREMPGHHRRPTVHPPPEAPVIEPVARRPCLRRPELRRGYGFAHVAPGHRPPERRVDPERPACLGLHLPRLVQEMPGMAPRRDAVHLKPRLDGGVARHRLRRVVARPVHRLRPGLPHQRAERARAQAPAAARAGCLPPRDRARGVRPTARAARAAPRPVPPSRDRARRPAPPAHPPRRPAARDCRRAAGRGETRRSSGGPRS
jgi:hypothetical protein